MQTLGVRTLTMVRENDVNSQLHASPVSLLHLLHLADSALPIGATAHSFGIETLIAEAGLSAQDLSTFFEDWLSGQGHIEATFCLSAHAVQTEAEWHCLNTQISSLRLARESRDGSLRLGKRFLALAASLLDDPGLRLEPQTEAHFAAAFGKVGASLEIAPELVAAAFLHQSLFGAISVCQRLLPFGQSAAMKLLWSLKPSIHQAVQRAKTECFEDLWSIQPMLEIASMRHPQLATRLFIS